MKKFLAVCISVILIISLCAVPSFAKNDGMMYIENVTCEKGAETSLDIYYEGNPGFFVAVIEVGYNPDFVEFLDIANGSYGNLMISEKFESNGVLRFICESTSSTENVVGSGVVATLKFKVKAGSEAGKQKIYLDCGDGDICNYDEELLHPDVVSGGITVLCKEHHWGSNTVKTSAGEEVYECVVCHAYKDAAGAVFVETLSTDDNETPDFSGDGTNGNGNGTKGDGANGGTAENGEDTSGEFIIDDGSSEINETNETKADKKPNLTLIIGIVILVIAAASIGAFLYIKNKKAKV